MKMRRIGDTGAIDRLAQFLKQKNAAFADQLKQTLNNLSDPNPYAPMQAPGGKPMPQVEMPQTLGQFEVTPIPGVVPCIQVYPLGTQDACGGRTSPAGIPERYWPP